MYFNETNDTNIDDELKGKKKKIKKEKKEKVIGEKKEFKFRFTPDTLLMGFYALLLIVGIVLIVISIK